MPGGRPTKYNQEVVDKAWDYINGEWQDGDSVIPSLVGMCRYLKRGKSTLYDWAKDPEKEFSDIVEALNELQEEILANSGLAGTFNPTITKLIMGKHGYSDRQEVQQETRINVNQLSDAELERIVYGES